MDMPDMWMCEGVWCVRVTMLAHAIQASGGPVAAPSHQGRRTQSLKGVLPLRFIVEFSACTS